MTGRMAYSYTLLRYVHDILTGEFLNVGVVMLVQSQGTVHFKLRSTIGRLKGAFPDIDRAAFVSSMQAARRGLQVIANKEKDAGLFATEGDACTVARQALPSDDSSLQWSACGSGLTSDPEKTLQRLFERLVIRYDIHNRQRKTDDDVWRPVRQMLEQRNVAQLLHEKSIRGGVDEIVFKHAWKNGQWHVYEPVSFDLADADGIKYKAREWLGHLSAVVAGGGTEQFKPHFIVGAPSDPALNDAYRSAIAILSKAPNSPEVFEEDQALALVSQIEDEVRAHHAQSGQFTIFD